MTSQKRTDGNIDYYIEVTPYKYLSKTNKLTFKHLHEPLFAEIKPSGYHINLVMRLNHRYKTIKIGTVMKLANALALFELIDNQVKDGLNQYKPYRND